MSRERERVRESDKGREQPTGVNGGQDGGWIPVVRNHRGQSGLGVRSKATFTLFVDNIPEAKDLRWLRWAFNKFGVVRDAFIPNKRSKCTGNHFGFVRYDCHVAAGMAISKMNGIWVDNRRLFVKEACFGLNEEKTRVKLPRFHTGSERKQISNRGPEVVQRPGKQAEGERASGEPVGRSYKEILNGESSKLRSNHPRALQIKPSGNGWLFRSAVAVMKRALSMMTLQVSYSMESNKMAQFRSMGGRSVLITFQSQEDRNSFIEGQWWQLWFETVNPWRGEAASFERFVWLSCKGIPLNVWNVQTFRLIAEIWGCFIKVDESTLKDLFFAEGKILIATTETCLIDSWIQIEVAGVIYEVQVSEYSSFVNPDGVEAFLPQSKVKGTSDKAEEEPAMEVTTRKEKVADDEVERNLEGGSSRERMSGMGWDCSAGIGGSKQENGGGHLMLGSAKSNASSEDFESRVEDSVELDHGVETRLGLLAQNNLENQDSYLAQEGTIDLDRGDGLGGPGSDPKILGRSPFGTNYSSQEKLLIRKEGAGHSVILKDMRYPAEGCVDGDLQEARVDYVRCSQLPSLNLVVDLHDSGCRRRRRRQLSNLASISEALETNPELVANRCSPSAEESPPTNPEVVREVRATMAVGGELGINFNPNDDLILSRMIELESQEYPQARERVSDG